MLHNKLQTVPGYNPQISFSRESLISDVSHLYGSDWSRERSDFANISAIETGWKRERDALLSELDRKPHNFIQGWMHKFLDKLNEDKDLELIFQAKELAEYEKNNITKLAAIVKVINLNLSALGELGTPVQELINVFVMFEQRVVGNMYFDLSVVLNTLDQAYAALKNAKPNEFNQALQRHFAILKDELSKELEYKFSSQEKTTLLVLKTKLEEKNRRAEVSLAGLKKLTTKALYSELRLALEGIPQPSGPTWQSEFFNDLQSLREQLVDIDFAHNDRYESVNKLIEKFKSGPQDNKARDFVISAENEMLEKLQPLMIAHEANVALVADCKEPLELVQKCLTDAKPRRKEKVLRMEGDKSRPRPNQKQLDEALIDAIKAKDLDSVKKSLQDGASANAINVSGDKERHDALTTAILQFETHNPNYDIIKTLIRAGANPATQNIQVALNNYQADLSKVYDQIVLDTLEPEISYSNLIRQTNILALKKALTDTLAADPKNESLQRETRACVDWTLSLQRSYDATMANLAKLTAENGSDQAKNDAINKFLNRAKIYEKEAKKYSGKQIVIIAALTLLAGLVGAVIGAALPLIASQKTSLFYNKTQKSAIKLVNELTTEINAKRPM